ncbi:Helix-turn-helix domain-containing protein [Tangfeifania diversioriginum]|uniref:Helix-turn-helix domain-containing protein n=1 Tax=Tangfeifania diversioriginum TaxID=1168035 RepID=A0A1M6JM07_9BACT|nr:helix-turn-helix domain-containing protein [Tangfeifania diversioriginum]SHJ47703.1 Helix-turn-helix domain-containing protein [Tangfeifania diversioriginum]
METLKNNNFNWLRSKDVREMLGISDSTLQTMRIKGTIPAYKLGATWFYREDEILETLFENKNQNVAV